MNTIEAPPQMGWWRRNVSWLIGALLLGAWAMVVPYREALSEYQQKQPSHPIDIAPGQWADYAGARWRLLGVDTVAPRDVLQTGLPAKSMVIAARFEVIPGPETLAKDLGRCQGTLSDAQGRRWGNFPPLVGDRGRYPQARYCGGGYRDEDEKPQPGRPFQFVHFYLIPRAQSQSLQGLHAEIMLPKSNREEADKSASEKAIDTLLPGSYLRFTL